MNNPTIDVGIMMQASVCFELHGEYVNKATGERFSGILCAGYKDADILFNKRACMEILLEPVDYDTASVTVFNVTIGKGFHWQRKQDQVFRGSLRLSSYGFGIMVINRVGVEEYLTSVISSEMNARAPKALLRAHAVISRSWVLTQLEKSKNPTYTQAKHSHSTRKERTVWYDRQDHQFYDVCADDHCQRYQGITQVSTLAVSKAVEETRGEVLTSNGEICDARFSKCCGGATEEFQYCWEPVSYSYLTKVRDDKASPLPDLTQEEEAERWIRSAPPAFCHTEDEQLLKRILKNYDRETGDFYRWKVSYSQEELQDLIARKTELDLGEIKDLIPLERGTSGRISRLKIVGKDGSYIIGKELEIRKCLSESHLYSSAFVVDKEDISKGIPQRFTLTGAGWGHGVGLCQIGAAVMGDKGYSYDQILAHYYPGASIEKKY